MRTLDIRLNWFLLLIAVFFWGCNEEKVWELEIVLPEGYHGVFKIVEDPENGKVLKLNEKDVLTIIVPHSGIVALKQISMFDNWHQTVVRYEDGANITNANFYELDANTLGFYFLWSDSNNNIYFLIGTKNEYESLQKAGPWEVEKFIPSMVVQHKDIGNS